MKRFLLFAITITAIITLTACGDKGSDIPPPVDPNGAPVTNDQSQGSMFSGDQTSQPLAQTPNPTLPQGDTIDLSGNSSQPADSQVPAAPGPGMFDAIPDTTPENSGTEGQSTSTTERTPREQMISLTDEWQLAIPVVNIELFKMEQAVLQDSIGEQFPLSLRYVWGQPKTRMEQADGGYRDIWEIGSDDGSFKGRIIVLYDGKDEVRATIISATAEVLVDDKNLTGKITPAEQNSGNALETLWNRMNDPAITPETINTDLANLTFEEAIIQWGKSDHKAEDGAYCWRVGDNFICILFNEEGAFSSYRIENYSQGQ